MSVLTKKRALFLFLVIVSLLLSGCGNGSPAADTSSAGAQQTAADTAEPETMPPEFLERARERFGMIYGLDLSFDIGTFRLEDYGVCFLDGKQCSWTTDGGRIYIADGDTDLYSLFIGYDPSLVHINAVILTSMSDPEEQHRCTDLDIKLGTQQEQGPPEIPEYLIGTWRFYLNDGPEPIYTEEFTISDDAAITFNGTTYPLIEHNSMSVTEGNNPVPTYTQVYSSPDNMTLAILENPDNKDVIGFCVDSTYVQYYAKDAHVLELSPDNWQDVFRFRLDYRIEYDDNDNSKVRCVRPIYSFEYRDDVVPGSLENAFVYWNLVPTDMAYLDYDLDAGTYTLREATEKELESSDLRYMKDRVTQAGWNLTEDSMVNMFKDCPTNYHTSDFKIKDGHLTCFVVSELTPRKGDGITIRGTVRYRGPEPRS